MIINRNSSDTVLGPKDWFTGAGNIDSIKSPSAQSRLNVGSVHFTPGARTAWHTHPNRQTIYVLEGICLAQRLGGPIEEIRPGERVFFEPNEEHWHGATSKRLMTYLAMQEVDHIGSAVTWGAHVTDEEYKRPTTSQHGPAVNAG